MVLFIPKIPEVQSTDNQRMATFDPSEMNPAKQFSARSENTGSVYNHSLFPVMKVDKVIKNIVYYINPAKPLLSRIS